MATSLRKGLGPAVRRLRVDQGFSQESFADQVGVHRTYMGAVERGEVNISLDNIERIAKGLGVAVSQLLREAEREGARTRWETEGTSDHPADGRSGKVAP